MTTKQLLLHIGTGKTGTTSIQESLHQAAGEGTLGDISYPSPAGPNHNFLAALYMAPDQLPREYRSRYQARGPEALERDASKFREALFAAIRESQQTILSAEYLGRFGPEELGALRRDLTRLGVDEVLVVAYVRDPASAYLSFVQQKVKAASPFRGPSIYRYPFRQVLGDWNKEFSDLVVRPFARDRLVGGDVLRDFGHIASSFFGMDHVDLPSVAKNQSVSAEGMILLQRYRQLFHSNAEDQFTWDSGQLVRILQESMDSVRQTPAALSSSAEQVVVSNHRDDLEWLWRDHGVDLRGRSAGQTSGHLTWGEAFEGLRYLNDVTLILESYDEDVVGELMLHCARQALEGQRGLGRQMVEMESQISELRAQLEDSRRDATLAEREHRALLASRSWRWGHRIAVGLSGPRRLIRTFRRD
jgi:hypothetical protein